MSSTDKHLCYDCAKASDYSCTVYNDLSNIVDDNFEEKKIFFQVKECAQYVQEK